ncbi:unnamed protein product [Nezara viridula]|uniref:Uncharacterized protein n=1 Tax=Nezara viridula TaxID=85310 RepID=A0A9P0E0G9_NEZVI|nr:unnamed protein product [Nezara viridula]
MSLLGFVPFFMSGLNKKKKKERRRMSFIKKIRSSEEKFEMVDESKVVETSICVRDFTLATAKEQRRKKISYSRIFSFFRSKPTPSKDIFTISGDICEMDDLENGRSYNGKRKKQKKDKERDYFSSLDQILLSLLNVGMMRKC